VGADEFVSIWRRGPLTRRAVRVAAMAVLGALVPLIVLGSLTLSLSENTVRKEVAARLGLTTALSGALVAEQVGSIVSVVEGAAKRPRLIQALADGDPDRFDNAEIGSQLLALEEYRHGRTIAGLLDLRGVLRGSASAPELVGRDFSGRGYFKGVVSTQSTYISEAFVSAAAKHPFVVSIATYVRGSSPDGRGPGPPLGVLAASVQLDEVQHIVDNVVAVQGVNLWIADQKGQLVAAPGGNPTALRRVADTPIGTAASIPTGRLVGRVVDGQDLLVVRQRVDPLGWTLFATVPRDQAYAGAASIRTTVLGIGIPLALIVIAGIVLLLHTQRRQWLAEAEVTAARDEAREASRQKSDFLANMSHELRTPLNAILGFSELMTQEQAEGDTRSVPLEWVKHIHSSGQHLLVLINDVLDLSKVEAGRIELFPAPLDLPTVIDETVAALSALTRERQQQVTTAVPPLTIPADRVRVRQILDNLLSNAIKFTPEGGQIFISAHRAGTHVQVSVTDTGPGISAADQARVFTEFTQVGDVELRQQGTGLGLPLARRLAQAHGGDITVESEPGHGARFTLILPAAPHSHPDQPADPSAAACPGGGILVIEDDSAAVILLRTHLERAGYLVTTAATGEDGLDAARACQPDLILLDLNLPGIHGRNVLQQLKDDPRLRHIPVAVISVADDQEVAMALGAVDYFVKPVNHDALLGWLVHHSLVPPLSDRVTNALVIDDDPATLAVVGQTLQRHGIRVVDATNGLDGLRLAQAHTFDLIICDLRMPGLDGFSVIAALHDDPTTRDVPVLVLTSQDLTPADRDRLAGKALAVISKRDATQTDLQDWIHRITELTAITR
jgi:signal transduction histidine kinase/CheY-like chemotaxis protein